MGMYNILTIYDNGLQVQNGCDMWLPKFTNGMVLNDAVEIQGMIAGQRHVSGVDNNLFVVNESMQQDIDLNYSDYANSANKSMVN